ncbi:hypothetical protein PMAYCL1PPCAC_25153, partial [Pristionchus mayeri]
LQCEYADDRDHRQRPTGQEGAHQVQSDGHDRRPEEADRSPDWNQIREDRAQEVVHHLQGPHHAAGLRGARRLQLRTVLPVIVDLRSSGPHLLPPFVFTLSRFEVDPIESYVRPPIPRCMFIPRERNVIK